MSLTAAEDILVTSEQGSVVLDAGAGLVLDTVNHTFLSYHFHIYLPFSLEGDASPRRGPGLLRGGGPVQALCLLSIGPRVQGERENYTPQKVSLMAYFVTMKVAVPDDNHVRPVSSQVGCHSVVNTELDPCN